MKKAIITFFKIFFFFIGWAVLAGLLDVPADNPAIWRFFAELIPLAVLLLFTRLFLLFEKETIPVPIKKTPGKALLTGTIIGFLWVGLASGILFISKQFSVIEKNTIPSLWLWIISAFINVIMQELLVRGYIYQLLKARYSLRTAVILTTLLFTVLHVGAFEAGVIPVVNVITMCLFTSALYESEGSLLAPIMAHAVWNIVGALFLGCVSLADDYPHMLTLSSSVNTLLSGGDYKLEGSIIVAVLNIALLSLFYARYKKRE